MMEPDTGSLPSFDTVQAPESTTPHACGALVQLEATRPPASECRTAAESEGSFAVFHSTPNGGKATPEPPAVSRLRRAAIIAAWMRTSGA